MAFNCNSNLMFNNILQGVHKQNCSRKYFYLMLLFKVPLAPSYLVPPLHALGECLVAKLWVVCVFVCMLPTSEYLWLT